MWKLEVEDLGREEGFDLEAVLVDDEDSWAEGLTQYGVVVEASREGFVFGTGSIWGVELSEDGDTMHYVLGTYGPDLISEAIADAQTTLEGLKNV